MAIAAATVWEINAAATAGNVNAGGFNPANTGNGGGPGTDRSQSTSAYQTFTDLASTSASSWLVITSASYSFVAADCGNLIHINTTGTGAHFSTGVYEILTVAGGAATLDRACGSGSNASGGTYHLGGAFSMNDSSDGTTFIFGVSGNSWWVKAGTYTFGANWNVQGTGTATAPMNFIGYQTTRGDNPTGTNRPLLKLNGNLLLWGTPYWNIANLSTIGTSTNDTYGVFGSVGTFSRITNCKAVNQSTGNHNAMIVGTSTTIIGCELVSYGGNGIIVGSNSTLQISDCYFHDSVNGILQSYGGGASDIQVQYSTFENCTTACINISNSTASGPYLIKNCTFYGGETTKIGVGIWMQQTTPNFLTAYNNIFYGLTTGINLTNLVGSGSNVENYNCFNNCTTARTNITAGANSITLNPTFTSVGQYTGTTATSSGTTLTDSGASFANVVAGRDFLYVSASSGNTGLFGITGGNGSTTVTTDNSLGTGTAITYSIIWGHNFAVGTNMKAVGYSFFGNINQTSYIDMGAVQRQEPVSVDPGIANVRLGTGYTISGSALTGTLNLPAVADVRLAVTFDNATKTGTARIPAIANVKTGYAYDSSDSLTGTYTGSDRWSDPGSTNVRNGTAYQANSLTNNETGSLIVPFASNVRNGIGVDAGTGNLVVPAVSNVKLGVTFDSNSTSTGTYIASCDYPVVGNVKLNVIYASGTLTGTYNPLSSGTGIGSSHLTEKTRSLIEGLIKANIVAELADIRTDRNDPTVNVEPPIEYFIYNDAHTYQCPAIFIVVDSGVVPDETTQTNYTSAKMKIFVSAVVEGQDAKSLTIKAERYQAALFKILHQTLVTDTIDNVKIYLLCKRFQFSPLYTKSRKNDNMGDFRKEVAIELEVKHWENPTA